MRKTMTLALTVLAALVLTLLFSSMCFAAVSPTVCCPDGSIAKVNPIQVYVFDEDTNLPLKNAKVIISGPGNYKVTDYTNRKGYTGVYSGINQVGEYYVDVTLEGRDPVRQVVTFDSLEPLCEPLMVRVPLKKPCDRSLEICVWDDSTSTAVPIGGASVTINSATPPYTATRTTLSDGCTLFTKIPAGTYTVTVSADGFLPATPATVVIGAADCKKFKVRIGLKKPCEPSMTVCVYDQDNLTTPIYGASVTIAKSGGTPVSMATTAGCAKFDNLTTGTYTITPSASGYETATPTSVTISAGDCNKQVNLYLKRTSCPVGRSLQVYVYNQNGSPINGATVVITSGSYSVTAITDATGFTPVISGDFADGTYTARVTANEYDPGNAQGTFQPGVCGKLSISVGLVGCCKDCLNKGTIQVKVRDSASGTMISGAKVNITGPGRYNVTDYTNSKGVTGLFSGAAALGTYNVKVTKSGYNPGTGSISISSPSTTTRVITVNLEKS